MTDAEARRLRNLKNSATVILKSGGYDNVTKAKIESAYTDEEYQTVLDIAAVQDIPGREALASKIQMTPNPNFKAAVNKDELHDMVVTKLIDAVVGKMGGEEIDLYLQKENEEQIRREGRMYEVEDREPRYLFHVEGIDTVFKSAAKAIAAYQEKHGVGARFERHGMARNAGFRRNPKFINLDSPVEEVVQAIPKSPELPEYLREEPEGDENRPLGDEVIEMTKAIREQTGLSMSLCKDVVLKSGCDMAKAIKLLRDRYGED